MVCVISRTFILCVPPMKACDLVKRSDTFKAWIAEDNLWMTLEEEQEVGIIIKKDDSLPHPLFIVNWSHTGISWEDEENLEIINEDH